MAPNASPIFKCCFFGGGYVTVLLWLYFWETCGPKLLHKLRHPSYLITLWKNLDYCSLEERNMTSVDKHCTAVDVKKVIVDIRRCPRSPTHKENLLAGRHHWAKFGWNRWNGFSCHDLLSPLRNVRDEPMDHFIHKTRSTLFIATPAKEDLARPWFGEVRPCFWIWEWTDRQTDKPVGDLVRAPCCQI